MVGAATASLVAPWLLSPAAKVAPPFSENDGRYDLYRAGVQERARQRRRCQVRLFEHNRHNLTITVSSGTLMLDASGRGVRLMSATLSGPRLLQ